MKAKPNIDMAVSPAIHIMSVRPTDWDYVQACFLLKFQTTIPFVNGIPDDALFHIGEFYARSRMNGVTPTVYMWHDRMLMSQPARWAKPIYGKMVSPTVESDEVSFTPDGYIDIPLNMTLYVTAVPMEWILSADKTLVTIPEWEGSTEYESRLSAHKTIATLRNMLNNS